MLQQFFGIRSPCYPHNISGMWKTCHSFSNTEDFRYRPGITYRGIASYKRCLYLSVTEMDCGALYGYKVPALSCGKPEKQLKSLWIWDNLGSFIAGFTTFVPLTYHLPSPLTSQISWRGCSWRQRHFLNNEITETSPWSMVSRGNGPWMASFWVITICTAQICMDMIEYASLKRTLEFRHLRDVNLQ